jgi:hypothetical protein
MEQIIAICPVWHNIVPGYARDPLDFNRIRFRDKAIIITRPDNRSRIRFYPGYHG